ncbi:Type 1 glutamine amidotransferase-like domain-containing protein [Thermasporomyces composti]|jgi:dipeptidase E|uniref:Dipeptidase E n=1 Tax=Thermasporomyces composti TaxID=696763 RepID=A0A3D9VH46_THECX|nr:Type 1 glutamine amidotransferase-like domain-containing protein [Thermasporomyces composti]REF36631.1 dipeptidase E [Thermasporomyces composti]
MRGRVFLAGGGGPAHSRPLDVEFARAVGPGPLSYWPVAFDSRVHNYDECLAWFRRLYEPLGVRAITMWTGESPLDLTGVRGVYIGGGNTYRLASVVHRWRMLDRLRDFVASGGVVFGDSAGAALLGADITTTAHLDRNEVGLDDTRGADLVCGHGVFVHHRDNDLPREHVWSATYGRPVIALTERANAIVSGHAVTAVGFDPLILVHGGTRRLLAPGATTYNNPASV